MLIIFLSSIFACKANPLPSPVTRVTITPTLTVKCARPRILAPTSRASGPSPIISLRCFCTQAAVTDSQLPALPARHPITVPQTPPPHAHTPSLFPSPTASQETNVQSALGVYHHHLWREESALELGHNPTHTAHTGEKKTPPPGGGEL